MGTPDGMDDLVVRVVVVADKGTTDDMDDLVVEDTDTGKVTDEVNSSCPNIAEDDNVFVRECSCCNGDIIAFGIVQHVYMELGIVQDTGEECGIVLGNEKALDAGNDWSSDEACEHRPDESDVVTTEDDCETERLAR